MVASNFLDSVGVVVARFVIPWLALQDHDGEGTRIAALKMERRPATPNVLSSIGTYCTSTDRRCSGSMRYSTHPRSNGAEG